MNVIAFYKIFFSFFIIVPAAGMCCFVLKNQLKFSPKKITAMIFAAYAIIGSISSAAIMFFDIDDFNFLLLPVFVTCFIMLKLVTRADISKCVFVFLSVCCLLSSFSLISHLLDSLVQNETATGTSLSYIMIQLGISIIGILLLLPLMKYFSWMIDNINIKKLWYTFSVLPLILICSNIYITPISYDNLRVGKVFIKGLILVIIELVMFILVFVLLYIVTRATMEKSKLTEKNKILEAQQKYSESLQSYINQTAKARHDFKHSIHLLNQLVREDNLSAVKEYLASYEKSLNIAAPISICSSDAINALLNYYRQEAIDNDIELNWNIDIPDNSRIQEVDMCSVLGNILENAVDGCKTLTEGRRYFNLTVEPRNGSLYIVTTNNFGEKLKKNGKDYLSTKHSGRDAIGLKSIRSIVEIYNGVFEAKNSDSDFYINALMKYV